MTSTVGVRSGLARLHRFLVPPESDQGWTAYLWLIYLGFFFIEWFFRPVGALEIALAALTLIAMLTLYFSAFRRTGRAALAHVIGLTALAVVWSPFNSGASVMFIYAASFSFLVGRPRYSVPVVFAIAAVAGLTAWLAQPIVQYWLPGVGISLIIGAANIYSGEQQRRNAELRLSQAEVRRLARVAERERIARDLHDVLGHTLSLIAVKSELAAQLIERDPQRAREEIDSVNQAARESLAEVRQAISGIRAQSLDQAVEQARLSLRAADVELELDIDPAIHLPVQTESMLGLVMREAVTNIIRHADARRCRIGLRRCPDEERIALEIVDDGRGTIRASGSGIQGMRARMESIGGELDIYSDNGGRLLAHLPEPAR